MPRGVFVSLSRVAQLLQRRSLALLMGLMMGVHGVHDLTKLPRYPTSRLTELAVPLAVLLPAGPHLSARSAGNRRHWRYGEAKPTYQSSTMLKAFIDAGFDFSRRRSSLFSGALSGPKVWARSRKRRAGSIQSIGPHQPV